MIPHDLDVRLRLPKFASDDLPGVARLLVRFECPEEFLVFVSPDRGRAGALGVPLAVRFFDVDVGSKENFGGVGSESGTGASM